MPRFLAQILSEDGHVIANNVDISINFSQRGVLQYWSGSFSLPCTLQFEPQKGSFKSVVSYTSTHSLC